MDNHNMMTCCANMPGMSWMMGGMWVIGILLLIALMLGIAALAKYLFFSSHKQMKQP